MCSLNSDVLLSILEQVKGSSVDLKACASGKPGTFNVLHPFDSRFNVPCFMICGGNMAKPDM